MKDTAMKDKILSILLAAAIGIGLGLTLAYNI
jgi:hypothetical protein